MVELSTVKTKQETYEKRGFSATVHVGQFVASEVELSRLWKCDRKTVSRVLDQMNRVGLISTVQVIKKADDRIKKADAAITRIETATGALERSAEKIEPALNSLADDISKDKRFKFTAQLDDKSIASVKAEHGEFITEEKKLLEEHRKALRQSMSESVEEERKAFENHQREMERTKEYGEGVWFSQRAWSWIGGFLIGSVFWLAASITAAIVLWVKR